MAAALRKWKRDREERGFDPAEPSLKRQQELPPVAPSAENDQVTVEPVISQLSSEEKYVSDQPIGQRKEVRERSAGDLQVPPEEQPEVLEVRTAHGTELSGLCRRPQSLKALFKDPTSLTLGINMFLPEDHQITLPSTEPLEGLMKQQGIMLRRKVEALGKYKEFCEILALYKKRSNSIDYVYKLAETLFANHDDILANFRTFLPLVKASNSEMDSREPDQQPALAPRRKVKFMHPSANVMENEALSRSSRLAEISRKGKEMMETTTSKEVARKLKERTSNPEEDARPKPTQAREPARMYARTATRRPQVPMAPSNAAAAGSPRPASDQRKFAHSAARTPSLLPNQDANPVPQAPLPPVPYNIAELEERLRNVSKCRPDCKACEYVEYPIFDWQAEDPEYYAKGKANRERERQALIARGVPGSFNDSEIHSDMIEQLKLWRLS